nr:MAG TPA: hypothetical protein [Caudoviricetes sp.]
MCIISIGFGPVRFFSVGPFFMHCTMIKLRLSLTKRAI